MGGRKGLRGAAGSCQKMAEAGRWEALFSGCRELLEIGRNGDRGGAIGSCRKQQENGGNGEKGEAAGTWQKMAKTRGGEGLP